MTNEIILSETNMKTFQLMKFHDLPHDYKENRLGELWKGVVNRVPSGGEKRKIKEFNPLDPLEQVMGCDDEDESLNSELDIYDITEEDANFFKKIIGIATETAKEEFPLLKKSLM